MNWAGASSGLWSRGHLSYHGTRLTLAAVLLIAAALKSGSMLPVSRSWTTLLVVCCESLLATWLISGVFRRTCWTIAIICFAGFGAVATWKITGGATNCGCFGAVDVSPWIALAIDVCAVLAMSAFFPRRSEVPEVLVRRRVIGWSAICAIIPVFAVARMATPLSTEYVVAQGMTQFGNVYLLDVESWVGRSFPLLDYVDVGEELKSNRWQVLLYRHDCPRCEGALRQLTADRAMNLAVVSVPPHTAVSKRVDVERDKVVFGRLQDRSTWIVETPTVVELSDGVVVSVTTPASRGA